MVSGALLQSHKGARDIGMDKFHRDAVTDIEALESVDESAFGGRSRNAHPGSLVRRAGHDAIKPRTDPRGKKQRCGRLLDLPFHFCCIVLLVGAVVRQRREFVVGVKISAAV
jgi:hypothetical protein